MVSRTKPLVKSTTITAPLAPFSYTDFGRYIDQPKIGNRMFFCEAEKGQVVHLRLHPRAEVFL